MEKNNSLLTPDRLRSSSEMSGDDEVGQQIAGQNPQVSYPDTRQEHYRKRKKDSQNRITELNEKHRERIRELADKHKAERKSLERRLKEQEKRSRQSLERELKQAKGKYELELEHIKDFFQSQNTTLRNELNNSVSSKLGEMERKYHALAADSQERIANLQKWFKDQLLYELQKKTEEVEQAKSVTDAQINDLIRQLDERNGEVEFLMENIREVARYLPKDVRKGLFEEIGLEEYEVVDKRAPKDNQRKPLLTRMLTSLF